MADLSILQRALSECWAAEISGIAFYDTLGERFPAHRHDADLLALVERTTSDLIEAVAQRYEVSIDHDTAERTGREVAQLGSDWREAMQNALAYTPDTLRMYTNLADVLPEDEYVLAYAIVEHERAQIVLFESVVAGQPDNWSAINAYLDRHDARHPS